MSIPRRRFTRQGSRIAVVGRRAGVRLSALIGLGFFVCIENPDTGELSYGDTPSMVRQALDIYGIRYQELEPERQASYQSLRQVYESVYGNCWGNH